MTADVSLRMAVIGAGPAGLALALLAQARLPAAHIALYDARPAEKDVSGDPRTLALALGSVQLLERLHAWPGAAAQSILDVQVSQAAPSPAAAVVRLSAADQRVSQLGAVLSYGALVSALQRRWQALQQAEPQRLHSRFGQPVAALKSVAGGVEVDAGTAETFDLAVVAEGGVFAEQSRKALAHDYGQTAWVGTAEFDGLPAGLAIEHFTRDGPLALLPLPQRPPADAAREVAAPRCSPAPAANRRRAALVWCVPGADDPVRDLNDTERLALLRALLPAPAQGIVALSPLKSFALGLNAETRLVGGRAVRIGNAAQTLHPVAGQGLNLGLRDAFSLVQALRDAAGIDAALRRVEWARAPDRWATIATTDFLARSFTWGAPVVGLARGVGLAALAALPPLRRILARQMMFGSR